MSDDVPPKESMVMESMSRLPKKMPLRIGNESEGEMDAKMSKLLIENKMSNMGMPSMQGVALVHKVSSRRSSMFEKHKPPPHGEYQSVSRGSFSVTNTVDPAVGTNMQSVSSMLTGFQLSTMKDLKNAAVDTGAVDVHGGYSAESLVQKKRVIEYENSYQLEPAGKPSRKELNELMNDAISNVPDHYSKTSQFSDCHHLGDDLADSIVQAAKDLDYKGYRYLCISTCLSRNGISAQEASRCLWDPKRDTWAEIELKLPAAIIFFQLYCIYLD